DLESISATSGTAAATAPALAARKKSWAIPVLAAVLLLALVGLASWGLRPRVNDAHPKLHRITFRRGTIWNARFTPDGNLIYGAAWEGRPEELFASESGSTESRPLGLQTTDILAISRSGELAVSTNRHFVMGFESAGMLARSQVGGGAPRDIGEDVEYADWSPDGTGLAVVRRVGGKLRLEYPLGKVLYETAGW